MMHEQQGLASQNIPQQPQAQPQPQGNGMDPEQLREIVLKVVEMLKQGVSEEELLQNGVPEEVIDMALEMMGVPDADNDVDNNQMGLSQMMGR